jgi:hypothetical protein
VGKLAGQLVVPSEKFILAAVRLAVESQPFFIRQRYKSFRFNQVQPERNRNSSQNPGFM